jgi:hypothetical protein
MRHILRTVFSISVGLGLATAGATQSGPNPFGNGKVYYTDSNSLNPSTPFYEYDVASDTWNQRASLPNRNTTQLAADEAGNVYSLPEDGNIYSYDPTADTWDFVMAGPAASAARRNISLFEAHNGEFIWGDDGTSTLYYTVGGTWSSIGTPRTLSAGSSIDRSTGFVYVRTWSQRGFFAFDPSTLSFPQICDDSTNVGENSRVGAFYDGEFLSRTFSGTYHAYEVLTCSVADTGIAPTSTHSATAEDGLGNVYSNGWNDDSVFEVFHVPTNTLLRLADAPDIPSNAHSTLVAVAELEIEIEVDIKPGSNLNSINPFDRGVVPVAILGSETFAVADVDSTTLAFGPGGAPLAHRTGPHPKDANHDGIPDLLAHFLTEESGIAFGDEEACVTGETLDGTPFEGCDAVRTVPPQ